jgi:hypothetical protein
MKTYYVFLACLYLLCGISTPSSAQKRHCGSGFNLEELKIQEPEIYDRLMEIERHTENFVNNPNTGISRLIKETVVIPVVVHILHNGEPVGTGHNLSDEQVESQIKVLNEDFRRLNRGLKAQTAILVI